MQIEASVFDIDTELPNQISPASKFIKLVNALWSSSQNSHLDVMRDANHAALQNTHQLQQHITYDDHRSAMDTFDFRRVNDLNPDAVDQCADVTLSPINDPIPIPIDCDGKFRKQNNYLEIPFTIPFSFKL